MTGFTAPRRRFLQGVSAGALVAATGALVACTPEDAAPPGDGATHGGQPGENPNVGISLPTYQKLEPVAPDLPGDAEGVPDAFFTFPESPVAVTDGTPGTGGTVTSMLSLAGSAVPPSMGDNAWWQGLNEQLGVTLDIGMTAQDYSSKVATTIAGGDIPDLVQVPAVARLPEVLEAQFEDLTEYLAGDAVLDYPCLASLPGYMWETGVRGGALRAVPPGNIVGSPTPVIRQDLVDSIGADMSTATDADSVLDLFVELTDAKINQYAMTNPGNIRYLLTSMFGAPNTWSESGGSFTSQYETEEYRAALEFGATMWDAGVFHPDTFGGANGPAEFQGGKLALFYWGGVGYRSLLRAGIPGLDLAFWSVPKADGSGVAPKRLGTGTYQLCAIRKQDSPDRVRELLRILNWCATPFGSQEYLYMKFGTEGTHWDWDDELQSPVSNQKLSTERINVSYFASAPYELFDPGDRETTEAMYQHQAETIPTGMRNPAASLYSPTNDEQGPSLTAMIDDVGYQVIQGRATLDDWDGAVAEWKSGGGDTIRGEYEESFADLNQ